MANEFSSDTSGEPLHEFFTPSGCLTDIGFAHLLSGSMTLAESRVLERHVGHCIPCRERVIEIRNLLPREFTEEGIGEKRTTPELVNWYLERIQAQKEKPAAEPPVQGGCPSAEEWYDYKHGLAIPAKVDLMKQHLTDCPHCTEYLQRLDKAAQLLDQTLQEAKPEEKTPLRTSCPDMNALARWAAGSSPPSEVASLTEHMLECAECRRHWIELSALLIAADDAELPIPSAAERRAIFDRALTSVKPVMSAISLPWEWARSTPARVLFPIAALVLITLTMIGRTVYIRHEARSMVYQGTESLLISFENIRSSNLRPSGGFVRAERQVQGTMNNNERKSLQTAEAVLTRAWTLRPKDPETNHALGRFFLVTKQLDRAEPYLRTAQQSNPASAAITNDLGVLAYERRQWTEAERYFTQAMALDPQAHEPVFNAAFLQLEYYRNAQAAVPLIAQYRRLDPGSTWLTDLEKALKRLSP